ncbi:hypothetical protein V8B55DRAFT_1384535 [Mucor lusitanicus]|uniref:NAD(P)-binding domain-containing protein n=2 Tax=Mucor circinelloides f. lusitanicus TaxID=29924 RepID=A0A168Q1K0_MUCCL|nr:hypothetical protein MUCCIDRAFT_105516 [Mucor lusitanicus CBS 277.49]
MSQQQQQFNTSRNVFVITNGDSLVGYALAYRCLEAMEKREEGPEISGHKLRILCRSRSGFGLSRLEKMGAEIMEVNYKDEDKMHHCMKDVMCVTMIPEFSSDREKEAECLIKAAKNQHVEHVSMMSWIGVDRIHKGDASQQGSEFRNLEQICRIEKMVKEEFSGEKHCIVRFPMLYQLFYYLAPQLEGDNCLCLPVEKNKKFTSLDLNDVVEGVYRLAKKQRERFAGRQIELQFKKQVYEFTCPKALNGEEMAREIGEGLGRHDLKFQHVSENDMKKQLEHIKKDGRFKERPDQRGDFKKGRDGFWAFPINKYIHESKINTMMEWWHLANKGELDMHSDELRHILDREPHSLKKYFEENRDQFKRFK